MMIVVPAFAHGEEGGEEIVSTVIVRFEATVAEYMRYRVNAKRGMIHTNGTDKKNPTPPSANP